MASLPSPARAARKLKLYVWEDAFANCWPGIAFALAHDVREARRLVVAEYGINTDYAARQVASRPAVVRLDDKTRAQAWLLSGGE